MKNAYNSLIKHFLREKKRRKMAMAVAAPLLVAAMLLTTILTFQIAFTDSTGTQVPVSDEQGLIDAVAGNADLIAVLTADITLTNPLIIPAGSDVTLTATDSGGHIIQPDAAFTVPSGTSTLLNVQAGGSLTLDGGVILQGSNVDPTATTTSYSKCANLVFCSGAFIMESGEVRYLYSGTSGSGAVSLSGAGANFTMNGGSVRNNLFTPTEASAVHMANNTYFRMNDGLITNNKNTNSGGTFYGGGVCLYAYVSGATDETKATTTFDMYGGTISYNTGDSGGGVTLHGCGNTNVSTSDHFSRSYFNMYGGTVTRNAASMNAGAGGGVYVSSGSIFNMYDGEISYNKAYMGGGVGTWDYYSSDINSHNPYSDPNYPSYCPAEFHMYGGSVSNNTSSADGGGIYIASVNNDIHAGYIENNSTTGSISYGGGIYVASIPYQVTLYNTLITNNTAKLLGGGMWFCPTGSSQLYINDGAAVYGNQAIVGVSPTYGAAGADLAISRSNSASIDVSVSNRMLGGGLANWYRDGEIITSLGIQGTQNLNVPRYAADAEKIPLGDITGSAYGSIAAIAVPSDAAQAYAESKATVFIRNNTSGWGGGVGSNGAVVTGKCDVPTKTLTVSKTWDKLPEGVDQPDSAQIRVIIDGNDLGEVVTLNAANNWTATLTDIPYDAAVDVKEVPIEGYTPSYAWAYDGDGLTMSVVVTNTYTPKEPPIIIDGMKTALGSTLPDNKTYDFIIDLKEVKNIDGDDLDAGQIPYTDSKTLTLSSDVMFENFRFEIPMRPAGTYYFSVTERPGSLAGWTYDKTKYIQEVVITEDGAVTVNSCLQGVPFSPDSSMTSIMFINHYEPPLEIDAQKVVRGQPLPEDGSYMFTFDLTQVKDVSGTPLDEGQTPITCSQSVTLSGGTTTADFQFELPVKDMAAGTYFYLATERAGTLEGWIYSSDKYIVQVDISETGEASVKKNFLGLAPTDAYDMNIIFTNTYNPVGSAKIIGMKVASGNLPIEGDFTFTFDLKQVKNLGGDPLDAGQTPYTDSATAVVSIIASNSAFQFNLPDLDPGTYYFLITERADASADWIFDKTQYIAEVNVSAGKAAAVRIHYPGSSFPIEPDNISGINVSVVFQNTYVVNPPWKLTIVKTVKGIPVGAAPSPTFWFDLTEVKDIDGTPLDAGQVPFTYERGISFYGGLHNNWSLSTSIDIPQYATGTRYYLINEKPGNEKNWLFDTAEYVAAVTAVPGGNPSVVIYPKGNAMPLENDWIPFTNYYTLELPTQTITVHKTVTGAPLPTGTDYTFTFDLERVANPAGAPLDGYMYGMAIGGEFSGTDPGFFRAPYADSGTITVSRDKSSDDLVFTLPLFPQGYCAYYMVTERAETLSGWKYDTAKYVVGIYTDEDGNIISQIYQLGVEGSQPGSDLTFINGFTSPGGPILPETGGIGTFPFIQAAAVLTALILASLAGALIYRRRKKAV